MQDDVSIAPFILRPSRINNYTHLVALLRMKQKKYKDCTHGPLNHSFAKVLGKHKEMLDLESVVDGFMHQKLKERADDMEKTICSGFLDSLDLKIQNVIRENDQRVYDAKIGSLIEIENTLFLKPSPITFRDELLYDLYVYINTKAKPIQFLEGSYLKYIGKYFSENPDPYLGSASTDKRDIKNLVRDFVKTRFNREEYGIEIYESRYLWAEIYVLYRIGRQDLVRELLSEFEIFFEFMAQKFRSVFLTYLDGKRPDLVPSVGNEDKFKRFLYDLADGKARSEGCVINTVEDYLWLRFIAGGEIKDDIERFESHKIKFMISLFAENYNRAIDVLLKSDFGAVAKFFLLREICFEQALDKPGSPAISPVFLNFLFSLVSKLSTKEHKVRLVEMLKSHPDYYEVVSGYIIKYSLFDILGDPKNNTGIDFVLDEKMASRVLQKLRESGDRQKLIYLHELIDDLGMVQLLIDAVEEAILIDEPVDNSIVEKYLQKKISKDSERLANLYGFYRFSRSPSLATLTSTVLFNQNMDLSPYRYVVERVFPRAVDIARAGSDRNMAKILLRLCGTLDLGEECANKASRDLVMLI